MPSERDSQPSDETDKGPGSEPFEGEGGADTGSPHETTPNPQPDESDSGTGANNQGAVQRPDQH